MAKKDAPTSYARSAGMQAAMSGVAPYPVPGAYISNVGGGSSAGEQKDGPAPRSVPGAYASNVKNGGSAGEQGSGLEAGATQPEKGEKGSTAGSGEYPMSKNAAWEAGFEAGLSSYDIED